MESKIVKADFGGLNNLVKSFGDGHVVRVGIFGDKTSRVQTGHRLFKGKMRSFKTKKAAPETNAELGALHEFGSFTKGIPARSFLRMPLHLKSKEILAEVSIGAEKLIAEGHFMWLLRRLGIVCENWVQMAFESGGFGMWKPNAPSTIRRKGSSSPLIDTAQLRRSISSNVI